MKLKKPKNPTTSEYLPAISRHFRFAIWMERLVQGIADGVIEAPNDH